MNKCIPLLLLALGLSACSAVYITKPIGDKPKNLTHEVDEWEGAWCNCSGDVFKVKVEDPAKGILEVACIEDNNKEFEFKKYTVYLRESGKWCFASFRAEDKKEELYAWARITMDGRQVVFWAPDSDKFTELVNAKKLPGKVDDKNGVILGELDPANMELITSGSSGVLLQWEKPMVLMKVSK